MTFAALMFVVLLSAIDATILASALPTVVGELHGVKDIAWVTTAFTLAQLAAAPAYGKLGDIYGTKMVLQSAIVVFLIGSVLSGLAQTMIELIAARALQGVGAGGLIVLVQTIVSTLVTPRERAKYQSFFAAVYGIASVGGPLLGGVLVQQLSWRWVFFVNLPVGIAAEIVLAIVLQPQARRARAPIDWLGAATIAAALACFSTLVTLAGNGFSWLSWQSGSLAAGTLLLAAAAVRTERRAADPVVPTQIVHSAVFRNGMVQTAAVGAVMIGVVTFTPLYFEVVKQTTPTAAGLLLASMMVGMVSTGIWSGRRVSRTGRYRSYPIAGFGLMALGLLTLSLVGHNTPTVFVCFALGVVGAGLGMAMQLILSVVQSALPREMIGTATSVLQVGRGAGSGIGPALLGGVFAGELGHAALSNPGLHGHIDRFTRNAYVHALRPVYLTATVFAAVGLLAAWRLEELPLSTLAPQQAEPVGAVIPAGPTEITLTGRPQTMLAASPAVERSDRTQDENS